LENCGSSSSSSELESSSDEPNLSYLLAAAVVLDSYFFKESLKDSKWNSMDTDAHEFLMQYADVGHDSWNVLQTEIFDV